MQVHHFVIYTVAWCDRGLSKIEMYRNSIFFLVLKGEDLDDFLLLHLFFRITQYNEDAHNTHAHSQADLKIPEVTTGASSSTGTSLNT